MQRRHAVIITVGLGLAATACGPEPGTVTPVSITTSSSPTAPTTAAPTSTPSPSPSSAPATTTAPTPTPTPTTAPPRTPTPTATQNWTVPDPITDEYAQRVLQELYNLEAQAFAIVADMMRTTGEVTETDELTQALARFGTEEYARFSMDSFLVVPPEVVATWADPFLPGIVSDVTVRSTTDDCMIVDLTIDPRPSIPATEPVRQEWRLARRPDAANPTGWLFDIVRQPGELPNCV